MENKMKLLIWIGSMNGVALHRLILPYETMKRSHEDVDCEFVSAGDTMEDILSKAQGADAFVFNRSMPEELLNGLKEQGVRVICDNDDYWMLSQKHPMYLSYLNKKTPMRILNCMGKADILTASTEALAEKMGKVLCRHDVYVFPNALNQQGQFARRDPMPSRRIRLGIIGSSSHYEDMELLEGINNHLPQEVKDRIQWVLCGFDKGTRTIWDKWGNVIGTEQTAWFDVCWSKWERNLTDNYKTLPESHKVFLQSHIRNDYETDDYYRRIWARPVNAYASLYDEIDVLVVPLRNSYFNSFKSELKMVEASIKGKGLIISNVPPYSSEIIPLIEKGGKVNTEGNCIAVEASRGVKGFAKAVCAIVKNPSLIGIMSGNLSKLTEEGGKFNLDKVTEGRYQWMRSLLNS